MSIKNMAKPIFNTIHKIISKTGPLGPEAPLAPEET